MHEEERQLRAIGYCRVACADKDTQEKLKHQRQRISDRAMMEDVELVDCYEEVGKAGEVLQELHEYCKEDSDIYYLLVSDFTRISSNPKDVEIWISKFAEIGMDVMWADRSPIDEAVRNRNKALRQIYVPHLVRGF